MSYYAHPGQSLVDHLMGVALRAKQFAAHFQGDDHAHIAGLLHDLGKAEKEFQKRIATGDNKERRSRTLIMEPLWPCFISFGLLPSPSMGTMPVFTIARTSSRCPANYPRGR